MQNENTAISNSSIWSFVLLVFGVIT